MKSESVMGQSSRDTHNEIDTVLADLGVVRRAKGIEIAESCIDKTHEKIKAEVV